MGTFVSVFHNVRDILKKRDYRLFRQILSNPQHSLHTILPPVRSSTFGTRDRGHPYEMPRYVSITYISNPLLIDASLSTYESNHKIRYAVSALIM